MPTIADRINASVAAALNIELLTPVELASVNAYNAMSVAERRIHNERKLISENPALRSFKSPYYIMVNEDASGILCMTVKQVKDDAGARAAYDKFGPSGTVAALAIL
jgi:hypothetical protein